MKVPTPKYETKSGQFMTKEEAEKAGETIKTKAFSSKPKTVKETQRGTAYNVYSDNSVSVRGSQSVHDVGGTIEWAFDIKEGKYNPELLRNVQSTKLNFIFDGAVARKPFTIKNVPVVDPETGEEYVVSNYVVRPNTPLSPEMIQRIKGNEAYITGEDGTLQRIGSTAIGSYVEDMRMAEILGSDKPGGFSQTADVFNIDEQYYHKALVPWDRYKQIANLGDQIPLYEQELIPLDQRRSVFSKVGMQTENPQQLSPQEQARRLVEEALGNK
jgi:hypothetical protein